MSGKVSIYAHGLCSVSVCAPKHMEPEDVARAVNKQHPSGVRPWKVSGEAFANGSLNPCQCEQAGSSQHWLLHC